MMHSPSTHAHMMTVSQMNYEYQKFFKWSKETIPHWSPEGRWALCQVHWCQHLSFC